MIFGTAISVQAQTGTVVYFPGSTQKISQLIGDYDRHMQIQTLNQTESRYGLMGTDLGVPFHHNGKTYLLFGDCWGTNDGDAIAYTTDNNPEDGIELTFITDGTGTYRPVTIPGISQGAYEVPMEGISLGGKMFIYHTTDNSSSVVMGRSVLAVSEDDGETFSYLYDISENFFLNVSVTHVDLAEWPGFPLEAGSGLVIFGSGNYRQSDVRLAYQPADKIEFRQSIRYFTGFDHNDNPLWSANEDDAIPLFSQPCVGELSITYNLFLQKWLMLYNCDPPRGINFRTADFPWGPWSEPQLLFDPWGDDGYCQFMHVDWQFSQCDSLHDPGREYEWGGEYGPYQFEDLATGNDSTTTIFYTLSTWNPYTVVLMKSTLRQLDYSTSIKANNRELTSDFLLEQNFPNPFHTSTTIKYSLSELGFISLKIYNQIGQHITTLVEGYQTGGEYQVEWFTGDLQNGMYNCRLQTDTNAKSIKLLLQK